MCWLSLRGLPSNESTRGLNVEWHEFGAAPGRVRGVSIRPLLGQEQRAEP